MSELRSPKKSRMIVGTYERVYGTCRILDPSINGNKIEFEHCGETKMDWDSQETVTRRGQRLFVDDGHNIWTEAQVVRANRQRKKRQQ
jgi:hypothetical protein